MLKEMAICAFPSLALSVDWSEVIYWLIPLVIYIALFLRWMRRTTPTNIVWEFYALRLVVVGGYILVVVVTVFRFWAQFGRNPPKSISEVFLGIFLAYPVFLGFCYIVGGSQLNIVLNSALLRHYKKGEIIEDENVRSQVKKIVRRWSLLHNALFALKNVTTAEVLERVCPISGDPDQSSDAA